MERAESRAAALVEKTRRRAWRHALLRAFLRALAAGLFLAAAAAALARLVGIPPDGWLLAALVPVQVLAALGAVRGRVTSRAAALLLDRQTGARERFTAVTLAEDPEVRELAARQALDVPAVRAGGNPVRFPPSREGLAVALGSFLLVLVLVLSGGADPGGATTAPPSPGSGGVRAAAGEGGSPSAGVPADDPGEALSRAARHIDAGEEVPDELWSDLEGHGVDERVRAAVREALARGDRDAALESLRESVGGGAGRTGTALPPGSESPEGPATPRWDEFEAALARPHWDPRYDDIVLRYFEEAGK